MVGRQRKIKKKHWLKRPSAVPKKRNLNQNINYSKSHIWNSFFENSISGIQSSYICPDVSVGIIWVSLKKLYSFLTYLTLKIICSRNTAKNLSDFINVPASMFLCSVRKNVCTTPFLDAQQLHFWSTLKANVRIFLYISPKNFCFRDVVRFYLVAVRWGRLNKFLKVVCCLGLGKYFTIFQFFFLIEIFENSTIFSISILVYSIKTLKFSRQFGL